MVRRKNKHFTAFLWHRRIGLAAIILVIILSITGIMLNHTESLELDSTYVNSSLVLNWYGLEPGGEPISYKAGEHTLSLWNGQLFLDRKIMGSSTQTLRGAVHSERFIVAAFDTELLLLSDEGEIIERMPTSTSFSAIRRIGTRYQRAVIETSEPLYYMADEHMLDWDVIINEDIQWAQAVELDETGRKTLREAFRGKGLSLERVTLDLHSGRIFGEYGIYLMDAAAIALLWLSLSGLWVWWRRRRKQSQKRHYQKHHRV